MRRLGTAAVSIHAPAWGATSSPWSARHGHVSIHAPAWGATARGRQQQVRTVSIHAPAWGATSTMQRACRFQSTPPRGGRLAGSRGANAVSIHAPAWGATRRYRGRRDVHASFNPRPRVGGDPAGEHGCSPESQFQSTPPRGGRPVRPPRARSVGGFNPRPRVGGDLHGNARDQPGGFNPRPRVGGDRESTAEGEHARSRIHAPAWGATQAQIEGSSVFQSTPPRGGRPCGVRCSSRRLEGFQSTPPRGGRPRGAAHDRQDLTQFQSTPPRGGRPACRQHAQVRLFQSTPPRGGRRRQRNSFRDNNKLSRLREPGPAISEVSYRDDCVLQDSTNVPAEGCALRVRAFSKHERGIGIVGRLCARMLDS